MAQLFKKNIIKEKLQNFEIKDLDKKIDVVKKWDSNTKSLLSLIRIQEKVNKFLKKLESIKVKDKNWKKISIWFFKITKKIEKFYELNFNDFFDELRKSVLQKRKLSTKIEWTNRMTFASNFRMDIAKIPLI